jgi:autotransporter-associated beta strand protein
MSIKRTVLWLALACLVGGIAGPAGGTPTTRTVGPFDITFYNNRDSDGESRGRQNWTTTEMNDVAAAVATWTSRLTNVPGRQIQFHLFWNSLSGNTLADSSGPTSGDGTTSWTYVEHVWRDGADYTGPWTKFDSRIRFDIQAAGVSGGWNFGSGTAGASQIDFRSVVTHELGHALGFNTSYYSGYDKWGLCWGTATDPFTFVDYLGLSAWDKYLVDNAGNRPAVDSTGTPGNFNQVANPVWFTGPSAVAFYGGNVPVYAPNPFAGGSSLSHLDETRLPEALMSPFVSTGPASRRPLRVEWEVMKDLGWSVLTAKAWTNGAGTLLWTDVANWSPDGAPDATWDLTLGGPGLADGAVMDIGGNQSVNILTFDGTGTFTVGGSSGTLSIVKGNVTRTPASSGVQTLARPVALGASAVWDIGGAGQLAVSGSISGSGYSLEKRGAGTLALSGANTYTGATTIKAGTVLVGADAPSGSAGALGNAASNILLGDTGGADDASLLIGGPYTVGRGIVVRAGSTGAATLGGTDTSGTATFSGGVTLAKDVTLAAAAGGTVAFTGSFVGLGGLTKIGDGTVLLGATNSYSGTTTVQAGTLSFGASQHLASLSIGDGAAAGVAPGGKKVIVTKALAIAESAGVPTATLDLADNALIVDYTGGTPRAPSPELESVRRWAAAGYAGMTWTGNGITSSVAALHPIIYSVGYAQNDMLFYPFDKFAGETVDGSTVLVKFTYAGDVNLDGAVDDNDVAILGLYYDGGAVNTHYWNEGDVFGYDGRIDDNDVAVFGLTYGLGIGDPLGGGPAGAVPEPATLLLLGLGGAGALARRRRSGGAVRHR